MGLLDKLFGSKKDIDARPAHQYQTVTGYRPVFESWSGHMYEQQLVRSVIERIAVACSKLEPEVVGSAKPRIARAFKTSPSDMMTWPRFLARCATIYFNDNNLFVVPQYKDGTDTVIGVYPLKPASVEVVEYRGEPWFRFYVGSGKTVALPVRSVCLVTRFQYESDFFGEKNNLDSTLDLMKMQEQADKEAIRAGSRIQWIGELGSLQNPSMNLIGLRAFLMSKCQRLYPSSNLGSIISASCFMRPHAVMRPSRTFSRYSRASDLSIFPQCVMVDVLRIL